MMAPSSPSSRLESLSCISAWIVLSSFVIVFNKWILVRFPFSIALTTWHMFFSSILTQVLSRTTSLIQPCPEMNARLYITTILPIGICFSMSMILSNSVYLHLSLSFIQMLKAIGPVATLLACWSLKIYNPPPSAHILLTIISITVGVAISSLGEMHFVLVGFLTQSAAVLFEAYKNALQQLFLNGNTKLSSMTLLYYFAPACTVINVIWVLVFELETLMSQESLEVEPSIFLLNAAFCFALNNMSLTVIKKISSLALTLSGIPKSILLSIIDMTAYHNSLTAVQIVGYVIAVCGTYRYSQLRNSTKLQMEFHEKKCDHLVIQQTIDVDEEAKIM